jgi:hypothetical protein
MVLLACERLNSQPGARVPNAYTPVSSGDLVLFPLLHFHHLEIVHCAQCLLFQIDLFEIQSRQLS